MKKVLIVLVLLSIAFIGYKSMNYDSTKDSIKAVNEVAEACNNDMQKNNFIICD